MEDLIVTTAHYLWWCIIGLGMVCSFGAVSEKFRTPRWVWWTLLIWLFIIGGVGVITPDIFDYLQEIR